MPDEVVDMSVLVIHPSLNRGGGAEKVCLTVVKTLSRNGYRVKLATIDKTDWGFLERRFGEVSRPSTEVYLMENMPIKGRASQGLMASSCFLPELLYFRLVGGDDLIVNTYGDLQDSIADITYMNAVPIRVIHHYRESGFSNSAPWRMIAQVYDLSLKPLDKLFRKGLLLSNSSFMQEIMKKHLNRDSMIVHPPVDVKKFQSSKTSSHRENLVATVARLRPGKNLNTIPAMAQVVKEAQFVVLGLADQASKEAIQSLTETIERLGVDDHVRLLVNQSFQILVDVLSSAKVFLHTQPTEAFGISVVESMAAGCVPVVPRAGGPWLDILAQKEGVFGFSYGSLKEAANRIKMLLEDNALRVDVSTRAMTRALEFDSAVFERRFLYVVEKLLSSR